jgi:pimeloyl-ACP methyl ester carboxylesterase
MQTLQDRSNGALIALPALILACALAASAVEPPPLLIAKEGWMYVGGHLAELHGKNYMADEMYTEYRIPAHQTHEYPIIMVHSGMSGVTYTGTPDGREGWAQYFVRQGYAVYVIDQPGRGRSRYLADSDGALTQFDIEHAMSRFSAPERYNGRALWPQAKLHNQWPGDGGEDDPSARQVMAAELAELSDSAKQQELVRTALIALVDKIGPSILLVYSQTGAFGWQVADARPSLIKAILAIEPNGPPAYAVEDIGEPDYFKYGSLSRPYGLTNVLLTYAPAIAKASELTFVQQDKPDGPGLVKCYLQQEPARQLPNLKMPILIVTGEASYHAPYDHCTVKYLQQAGAHPTFIRLADRNIRGNGHAMMFEKNSSEIAAVLATWLDETAFDRGSRHAKR